MDDQAAKLAEALALLSNAPVASIYATEWQEWLNRRDALLAPPPDPDGLAREAYGVYHLAATGKVHTFAGTGSDDATGWRAIADFIRAREQSARNAALREAIHVVGETQLGLNGAYDFSIHARDAIKALISDPTP